MLRILHITTGLNDGGAEAMLYRLIVNDNINDHVVISLMNNGKYGELLEQHGIAVYALKLKRHQITIRAIINLVKLVWRYRSYTVQTWMYHGDFLGGFIAFFCGVKKIVWGVHNTVLEQGKSTRTTIWIANILAKVSGWLPSKIVVVSERAIAVHESIGYDSSKMEFIPNGYDLSMFRPDNRAKVELRSELDIQNDVPVICCVGRYDPYKDHENLISALAHLRDFGADFICIMVGKGIDKENVKLNELIDQLTLRDNIILLGQRNDIPRVMNLADIYVLSSSAEAFPNVVCEAMACGTPCVVTDVGDARSIVGNTGWVVPAKKPLSLANSIYSALNELKFEDWSHRSESCRNRIKDNYSIEKAVGLYTQVWNASDDVSEF